MPGQEGQEHALILLVMQLVGELRVGPRKGAEVCRVGTQPVFHAVRINVEGSDQPRDELMLSNQ